MKKAIAVLAMVILVAGCAGLSRYEERTQEGINAAKPLVSLIDPATGGIAGLVYTGAAAVATTVFGVNRALLARKQAKAIKTIDANPDTPKAVDQAAGDKAAQKVIVKIVGA